MSNNNSSSSGGIGFLGVLTIVFIVLKLVPDDNGHIIDWSWWWVLSPLWIPFAILLVVIIIGGLMVARKKGVR